MDIVENSIAVPLFVSNFVTLLLIVYFGRDRNRQRTAHQSQIAQLEAKSLKAQMNPHFIFNTLNGIQSLMVLKGEKAVNKYIGLFSTMLRKTLDFSLAEDLSLKEEIDYIKAYIDLQNMRRKAPVNFELSVAETIDLNYSIIAPMLLQPLVENCMLHAFKSQQTPAKIRLRITEKGNTLMLKIEDNGQGRAAARKAKQSSSNATVHHSYGSQILKERIDVLNYLYKERSAFWLEDIVFDDKVQGTRSVLILPKVKPKN